MNYQLLSLVSCFILFFFRCVDTESGWTIIMETGQAMGCNVGPTTMDLSVLQPPIHMGVTGALQVLQCMTNGTQEMKHLLQEECHFIYECSACGSLFRSVANLLSHKRIFCRVNHLCEDFGLAYTSAMEQAGLAMPPGTGTQDHINPGDNQEEPSQTNELLTGEGVPGTEVPDASNTLESDDNTMISQQSEEPLEEEKYRVIHTKEHETDKLVIYEIGNGDAGGSLDEEASHNVQETIACSREDSAHAASYAETVPLNVASCFHALASAGEGSVETNALVNVSILPESSKNEAIKSAKSGKHSKQKHRDPDKKHKRRHSKKRSKKIKELPGSSSADSLPVTAPRSRLRGREKRKGRWAYPCLYCSLTFVGSRVAIEHISIAHKHGQLINTTRLRNKIRRKSFFIEAGSSREKLFHVKSTNLIVKKKKKKKKKKKEKSVKSEPIEIPNNLVGQEPATDALHTCDGQGHVEGNAQQEQRILGEVHYLGDTASPALMGTDVTVKVETDMSYCCCGGVGQSAINEGSKHQGQEGAGEQGEDTVYPCFFCQTVHSDIDVAFEHVRVIHKDKKLNHGVIRRKLMQSSSRHDPL